MGKGNKPYTVEIKDGDRTIYKRKLGRSGKYDSILQSEISPIEQEKLELPDGSIISIINQDIELKRARKSINDMMKVAEEYLLKNPASKNEKRPPERLSQRRRAMTIIVRAKEVLKYLNDSTHLYAMGSAIDLQKEYDDFFFADWEEFALVGSEFYKRDTESQYSEKVKKEEWEKLAVALWKKDEFKNTTKRQGKYNIRKTAREIQNKTGDSSESIRKFLSEFTNK